MNAQRSEAGSDKLNPQGHLTSPPSINLPKGGGAIRGIGEKFAANPVTGTGSTSIPIATSPGRSGFGPELSLSYDSGSGNGPFGFGWSLSLPSISRKTDKGLPRYIDGEDSDVFILSGAEDLVPEFKKDTDGNWEFEDGKHILNETERTIEGEKFTVRRYRPRTEGLFARIERWTKLSTGEIHWRSISRDNITTLYGKDNNSRIFDPAESPASSVEDAKPVRIFSWLICETYDDKGNVILYEYKQEDSQRIFKDQKGQSVALACERNRKETDRSSNRYIKRIKYGNRQPNRDIETWLPIDSTQLPADTWMFEVIFDYGEGHFSERPPDQQGNVFAQTHIDPPENSAWPVRPDPFSTYRPGFEIRTYRLCQRVLMLHHFKDEPNVGENCLVRSTDFTYSHEQDPSSTRNPVYTFLNAVTQSGYKKKDDAYLKRSMPSVEFTYSQPEVQDKVEYVDAESLENLPSGVDGRTFQWTDLHGEGVPGILTEQAGAWFYKRNLSPISKDHNVEFGPQEQVAVKPALALAAGAQFMDLAGDGFPDLVTMDGPIPGLFEHDEDEGWQSFRPFASRLNRPMNDPNLKLIDLDGDGHADVLITEDDAFIWHASLAEDGFEPALRVSKVLDEEKGPRVVFADGTQSIYLADMSGDGLTDLLRIRNGETCYWPNLGYCRFGAKVSMDHSPWFDAPDLFDHNRVRLADIDGTGTTDIIYLHQDGVRLYFNQSGNRWSDPKTLRVFPRVDNLTQIMLADLLGNGTACLVWSSPLEKDAMQPMRYVNLMGKRKPHLLVKTDNNLGAETIIEYASSAKFYLQDKQNGTPWITRLPFPVHVVEKVVTIDHISRNHFSTQYSYHHGYFDVEEREFRGFGKVDQRDTETIDTLQTDSSSLVGSATNLNPAFHLSPVLTKTWFHTGAFLKSARISLQYKDEYFTEPGLDAERADKLLLADTILPGNLTAEEAHEACRALRGSMLRQEVYAEDSSTRENVPYTVTEQNFSVRKVQPRENNRHGVFFTHPREAITYHYERDPADPRIQHNLTVEVDEYGNVLKEAAVAYGRRKGMSPLTGRDKDEQEKIHITYTENEFTKSDVEEKKPEAPNYRRLPLPCETRTYEIPNPKQTDELFTYADLVGEDGLDLHGLEDLDYEKEPTTDKQEKRIVERTRILYRSNDLKTLLSKGKVEHMALPGESYTLAFSPNLIDKTYRRKIDDQNEVPLLTPDEYPENFGKQGGYVDLEKDNHWWIPSGRVFFSPDNSHLADEELNFARLHFFLPHRFRDPFYRDDIKTESIARYDSYRLLVEETVDALNNEVRAVNDYRVLQPAESIDANDNHTIAAYDALGMVVATAIQGKITGNGSESGDNLEGLQLDPDKTLLDDFYQSDDPHIKAAGLLQKATSRVVYDLDRFKRSQEDNPNDPVNWQPVYAATLARETHVTDLKDGKQTKIQIIFSYSDGFGREIQKKIQAEPEKINGVADPLRWVGSGWTIFNNKGKPVQQFEPFFSQLEEKKHQFEYGVKAGVSPVIFYDPLGRVIVTLHPNNTYEKVMFGPWQQCNWDVNDTVLQEPRMDMDIRDLVQGYFQTLPGDWKTWYQNRQNDNISKEEKGAADKAADHADTPVTIHLDSLGRHFLSIADNGLDKFGQPQLYETRVVFDIEGNEREVIDAKGQIVMRYAYNMAGPEKSEDDEKEEAVNRIHQSSMEAGERWILNDVAGNPIRTWDSRGHVFTSEYDELRRPVRQFVLGTDLRQNSSDPRTIKDDDQSYILFERIDYGEGETDDKKRSLRGQVVRQFDGAGVITSNRYDFEGNLLESSRQLCKAYREIPDWSQQPELEQEVFSSSSRFDALNRPIQVVAPHSDQGFPKINIFQPGYNEANLLERMDVWLEQSNEPEQLLNRVQNPPDLPAITNMDYDAKGQRTLIQYGNGSQTRYFYDEETFRLTNLLTIRGKHDVDECNPRETSDRGCVDPPDICTKLSNNRCVLQNLSYFYDPAGNITHIRDDAQQLIFFRNRRVEPSTSYTYDPLYRLIKAEGREHLGQGHTSTAPSYEDFPSVDHPSNTQAMGRYVEKYIYDQVGNIMEMVHRSLALGPEPRDWTRKNQYNELSQIHEDAFHGMVNNRLTSSTVQDHTENFRHDVHGNMISMGHLSTMLWDFQDQLLMTRRTQNNNPVNDGSGTWYVYDAGGDRVRKVTESSGGSRVKERIYLGSYEVYRKYKAQDSTIDFERQTLHAMDDQQRIALVETRTQGQDKIPKTPRRMVRYQYCNHLGSSALELDDEARIISYEEYFPYGSTSYRAQSSLTEVPKRYCYTGKEKDEETGLNYHSARYYAPWLGRWVSFDQEMLIWNYSASKYQGEIESYFANNNNPIIFIDTSGNTPYEVGSKVSKIGRRSGVKKYFAMLEIILKIAVLPPGSFELHDPKDIEKIITIIRDGVERGDKESKIIEKVVKQKTRNSAKRIPPRAKHSIGRGLKGAKPRIMQGAKRLFKKGAGPLGGFAIAFFSAPKDAKASTGNSRITRTIPSLVYGPLGYGRETYQGFTTTQYLRSERHMLNKLGFDVFFLHKPRDGYNRLNKIYYLIKDQKTGEECPVYYRIANCLGEFFTIDQKNNFSQSELEKLYVRNKASYSKFKKRISEFEKNNINPNKNID